MLESRVRLTVDPVDPGLCKDKSDYYYSFKIWVGGRPRLRPESRVRRVNLSQHKIKVIIIIILKLDLRVNSKQEKIVIIIVLKPDIVVDWSKAQVTSWEGQHTNKNCYYLRFKTRLESSTQCKVQVIVWEG